LLINLTNFFVSLTWFSFLTILTVYLSYLVLLYYFNRKAISNKKQIEFSYPAVSLIIPVYNEEKIIERKIRNIEELVYPSDKIEVIFVDGKSTDKTEEIIADLSQKSQKNLEVIRQNQRNGYTKAVIQGILNSKGEIIVATDGASFHYPDALLHLVKHFKDGEIGAVTGQEVVMGSDCNVGPRLEKSYRHFYDFMRTAETELDSTPDTKGEILAVRKEICTALIKSLSLSPNASFDSCVPYQAKMMGYRTIYDEDAKYYECAPSSFSDRTTQQVRRATLLIGALLLFKGLILNRKSGRFGLLILPAHFLMWCVIPSLFFIGVVSLVVSSFLAPLAVVGFWIVAILLLAASQQSRSFLVSFVQSQYALVMGLFRLAKRRESLLIQTIPSTRESF
jgi:cellulose synthase/poly-beta-1,6-N-acetylglucosamine synthase-like glycosyltransferase